MNDVSALYGSHTINRPPHSNGDGYISVYEGESDGLLCSASGRVAAAGYTPYESVYLINRLYAASQPSDDEFIHVGDEYNGQQIYGAVATLEADGSWAWDGPTGPNGGEVPAWVGQKNRLWAAAEMMSNDYELELFVGNSPYDGVAHDCSSLDAGTAAAAEKAATGEVAGKRLPLSECVQPTAECDGWLEYRHLPAHSPPFGQMLMLGHKPLRASVLAVAAEDVSWTFRQEACTQNRLVSRPMGLPARETGNWWYGKVPPAALVLTQGGLSPKEVVVSPSREAPDVFSLAPNRFVFVKINCPYPQARCQGGYSLWVKPIA